MTNPAFVQRFQQVMDRVLNGSASLDAAVRQELAQLLADAGGPVTELPEPPASQFGEPQTLDPLRGPGNVGETLGAESSETLLPASSKPPTPPRSLLLPPRYDLLGLLGRGGMGEVYRVRDRVLNRPMALKVLRTDIFGSEPVSRFVEEAQATAQLQHPGIVPVHDLGQLPDGRTYFTMKEVQGRTLQEVMQAVHAVSTPEQWGQVPDGQGGWSFHRLMDVFHRVCEAMAYAHARGVLHRDLKPSNVMVGAYGEVLVLDWGLAKVLNAPAQAGREEGSEAKPNPNPGPDRVQTRRSEEGAHWLATEVGRIAGTPAYMPPEQARGEVHQLSPASDVYALGALLYEILTGRAPYAGDNAAHVLKQVLQGPPHPVRRGLPARVRELHETKTDAPVLLRIPEELAALCEQAMARAPEARPADAGVLAQAMSRWLDGAQRRERAEKVLNKVRPYLQARETLLARAKALRAQAKDTLADVKTHEGVERKLTGWQLEDEAQQLEQEAELKALEYVQGLRGALTHDPDMLEIHDRLAHYYHQEHREAEARRDNAAVMQNEVLLKAYDRRGEFAAYLQGDGAVTLLTDPTGADVQLFRFETFQRRLVPVFERSLGSTPLHSVRLARGSYLLRLEAAGRSAVQYPVFIGRGEHWDGIAPGESAPRPIPLPLEGALKAHDCYVPPGWFWCGGDAEALSSEVRRRAWVEGFVMRRFPATNLEYLAFLNDLLRQGREADALRFAPRERASRFDALGALCVGRDADGHFILQADAEGDEWLPTAPVLQIDWWGAHAYALWEASRMGAGWRLPSEREREKAGRGVDGRIYPWGNYCDPSWASIKGSQPGRPTPAVVDSFPIDESVYGLRGMGGNVQDWCRDVYYLEGPRAEVEQPMGSPEADLGIRRARRGGDWGSSQVVARCATRVGGAPSFRYNALGVRLARPLSMAE